MLIELLIDPSCKRIVFNRFGDNRNGCLTNIPQDIVTDLDHTNLRLFFQQALNAVISP